MAKLKKVLEKREGEFSSYRNCWLFSVSLSAMLIGERKAKRTRSWLIPQPLARIGLAQQSKAILLDSDLLPVVVAFGLTTERISRGFGCALACVALALYAVLCWCVGLLSEWQLNILNK